MNTVFPTRPRCNALPALHLRFFLLLLILVTASCQPAQPPAPLPPIATPLPGRPYNVLILNSYHIGYQWSEDIVKGITDTFLASPVHPEIYVEYMDAKRYPPERIVPALVAMYTSKYQDIPLDLIISTDNSALSFLATYHDQLFPGVPVVFVGVNGFTPQMLGSLTDVTGIVEREDMTATIDLILQLIPQTRHLAVINDSTDTGLIHAARFEELAPDYAGRLEFIHLSDLTRDELTASLSSLPEDTAIFFRSFFRDRNGQPFTVEEALRLVTGFSPAPIFTTWDFNFGQGVVGGALLTGRSQGQAAAGLALQILQGTPAASIPLMESSPTDIILNYDELLRYQIPLSNVPEGSILINQPSSLYREFQTVIRYGGIFVIIQTLVILLLVMTIRRRHQAEQQLAAAEARLNSMLQTVVDGVIVINRDQTLAYINPAGRVIFDLPDSVQVGDSYFQMPWVAVDDADSPIPHEEMPIITALLQGRETSDALYRVINQAGDVKWLTVSAAPIRDQKGQITSAIASVSDSTARQFAIQAIQKSEKRFRTLFEQVVDAIIISDLDGRLVDMNQRACDLLGYTRSELLHMTAFDIAAHIDKETILAEWAALAKVHIFQKEGFHRSRSGEDIPVEMHIGLIELEGRHQVLIISRDITERRLARQKLEEEHASLERRIEERTAELRRLNANLRKASRAKDEFLANMSHELRTPLSSILGMSEMLGEGLHGPLNERQTKYIHIIENSGRHLLDLINDILNLSKIESGQLTLDFQTILIDDICQSSLSFVQHLATARQITIQFSNRSSHTSMMADVRGIKQVLVNLLSNAIKFSPQGGQVDFLVEDLPCQNALRFSIHDQGIGIPLDKMPRLFKPFSQIDSGLSRSYEGTGLGLALVARLVAMHRGSVSLDSPGEEGTGSTFSVSLPLSEPQPEILPDWIVEYNQYSPLVKHVLLVEDDEACAQVLVESLSVLGCQVSIAHSGLDALQMLRQSPPQVTLLKMQIPDMDGWQVLAAMQQDPALASIPVIAITSLVIVNDEQRYAQAGAAAFLARPFPLPDLLRAIQTHRRTS